MYFMLPRFATSFAMQRQYISEIPASHGCRSPAIPSSRIFPLAHLYTSFSLAKHRVRFSSTLLTYSTLGDVTRILRSSKVEPLGMSTSRLSLNLRSAITNAWPSNPDLTLAPYVSYARWCKHMRHAWPRKCLLAVAYILQSTGSVQ